MAFVLEPLPPPPPPPPTSTIVWHCAYCGQSNAAEREGCRGCQAARPAHAAMIRESVATWKGVPLSELTEEERDDMRGWMSGPEAGRCLPGVGVCPQPRPELHPVDSGWDGYPRACAEHGNNKATQRTIIQRVKQFVGLEVT